MKHIKLYCACGKWRTWEGPTIESIMSMSAERVTAFRELHSIDGGCKVYTSREAMKLDQGRKAKSE